LTKEIKTGKGTKEIHVSPYTPNKLGREKIILRQKDYITKKIIKKANPPRPARKSGKKLSNLLQEQG